MTGINRTYDSDGTCWIHYNNGWRDWKREHCDMNGNVIYCVEYTGDDVSEWWYDYDSNGREICARSNDGSKTLTEYCPNGEIHHHSIDSDGKENLRYYDSENRIIYSKYSNGYETWYVYDSNGREIHYKDSNGYETWSEYDSNGNLIHFKNSDGYETWSEYDSNGNLIHYKDSNGYEEIIDYSNGRKIHYRLWYDKEWWNTDSNGNLVRSTLPNEEEIWEYSDDGRCISHSNIKRGYDIELLTED